MHSNGHNSQEEHLKGQRSSRELGSLSKLHFPWSAELEGMLLGRTEPPPKPTGGWGGCCLGSLQPAATDFSSWPGKSWAQSSRQQ